MRILILAANGQLGSDLVPYFSRTDEVISYKDVELDITDEAKVFETITTIAPQVIINCAAITNVDGCESNPELAFRVNDYGAGVVAKAAESVGAELVHISTDYVFDGRKETPYLETDQTDPQNVYGKSKLQGEIAVLENCKKSYILRTAWLYGPNGNNFVKTMMRIARESGKATVVTDQVGNPTSTFELARMMNAILKSGKYGIYHTTCEGVCSWNTFAREIFRLAELNVNVQDVTSEQFVRPAKRPAFSHLSKEKLWISCGYRPADWQAALQEYFDVINDKATF